jgi:hypothetical protein
MFFPVVYLSGFFMIFYLFANYNKQQKLQEQLNSKYFDFHLQKFQYDELAEMFGLKGNGRILLETALMQRAVENIERSMRIQEEKQPLQQMVREGIVGEDLLDKINLAEQELNLECDDVCLA